MELLPLARWAQIELYILCFCYHPQLNLDSTKRNAKDRCYKLNIKTPKTGMENREPKILLDFLL